jgi:hypothetical protein
VSFLRVQVGYKQQKHVQFEGCCVQVLDDILVFCRELSYLNLGLEAGYLEAFRDLLQHLQQMLVSFIPAS